MGKPAGLVVLVLDASKGAATILIGQRLGAPDLALYTAAVAAALNGGDPRWTLKARADGERKVNRSPIPFECERMA